MKHGQLILAGVVLAASAGWIAPGGGAQDVCFEAPRTYAAGAWPHSVYAADLDRDNDIDVAVANYHGGGVSVLLNNGDGSYQAAADYPTGDYPVSVVAADLNNDLAADLVVGSSHARNRNQ